MRNQQCKDCQQDFATGSWHAVVQVRQRVTHKRTFYYLEQLLLKHNAHSDCLNIVTFRDGMDFYFTEKQKAVRFIDFLESHVPTKVTHTHIHTHTLYAAVFSYLYACISALSCLNCVVLF